jgi:hypothetical protein
MRTAYSFEPKYTVELLAREDWTLGTGFFQLSIGTSGSHMGPGWRGTGAGISGQSNRREISLPLGRFATVFQAEVFAFLSCVYDIDARELPGKHVSICAYSQEDLKALGAVITTSRLLRQCQEALYDISTWHAAGLYPVPGHAGVQGIETTDWLARNGSTGAGFGVFLHELWSWINCWEEKQHHRRWWILGDSQRQARELISGPSRGTRIRLLYVIRVQSKVVTGILTGYNTLRRHLHLMGLKESPMCRKCGVEGENSAHIFVGVDSVRHAYLNSFCLGKRKSRVKIWGPCVALLRRPGFEA